jgi:phospholipid/cholesterol/gamma-HCH transport system permease protein
MRILGIDAVGGVDAIGASTVAFLEYVLDIATLVGYGAAGLLVWPLMRPVARTVLARQIFFTGVEAVRFVALLAALTASTLVMQSRLGGLSADFLGEMMVVVLVRELGPLLLAMVVIARSGSAIAVELANMRIGGEIQALEWSGIDPFSYLVLPRLGGACVSLVCLVLLFIAFSLAGGFVLGLILAPHSAPDLDHFTAMLARHLTVLDAAVVLAKTVVPGFLIAAIAAKEGIDCAGSVTEVPRATTRAVVRSIAAVAIWDALVTALAVLA